MEWYWEEEKGRVVVGSGGKCEHQEGVGEVSRRGVGKVNGGG